MRPIIAFLIWFIPAAMLSACAAAATDDEAASRLVLPPGFKISPYVAVDGVRTMAPAPDLNVIFIGTAGKAIRVVTVDDAGEPTSVAEAKTGLTAPHGVAVHDGFLYVGERHRVTRYDLNGFAGRLGEPETLLEGLTNSAHHGRRVLAVGPDGMLYVSIGTPCNICFPRDLQGTILRLPPAGGEPEIFASGIRNSVGLDFHPTTGVLHFSDNGADNMGDDLPPEELNAASTAGLHFGYPYFGGGDARVDRFRRQEIPGRVTFPVMTFPAHNAPLGVHFYRGDALPIAGDALVALHGSWNRSEPDGYRVVRVPFDADGTAQPWQPFIDGFLSGDGLFGRPVDIKTLWDGSLLVSDDYRDLIYRVTYQPD